MMDNISDNIMLAKKYNVALKGVYNVRGVYKWKDDLSPFEDDFKVSLNEDDRKALLKGPRDLRGALRQKKLHTAVLDKIAQMFDVEKMDGKRKAAELLNDSAELLGLMLKAFEIKTSQIRRYLDSLRKIKAATHKPDMFSQADVLLQQVKVAYAAGRNSDLIFLYEVMKPAITEGSESYHHFEQLLRFVEAIVAYHRFYKGED